MRVSSMFSQPESINIDVAKALAGAGASGLPFDPALSDLVEKKVMRIWILTISLFLLLTGGPLPRLIAESLPAEAEMACCATEATVCPMAMGGGMGETPETACEPAPSGAEFCACLDDPLPLPVGLPGSRQTLPVPGPVLLPTPPTLAGMAIPPDECHPALPLLELRDRSGTYLHLATFRL
jgi:hypothetical protein